MLTQKAWRAPEMLRLLLLLVGSYVLAGFTLQIARALLLSEGQELPPLARLVAGYVCLHVPGFVLLQLFLLQHQTGWRHGFGVTFDHAARWVPAAVLTAVVCLLVGYPLQYLCRQAALALGWNPELQEAVQLLNTSPWPRQLLIGVFAVIGAPIVEEGLFRGILYQWIRDRRGPSTATLVSALLFGFVHGNLTAFLPIALFGAALALLYERTGNLLACMTAHCLFNLAGFLIAIRPAP